MSHSAQAVRLLEFYKPTNKHQANNMIYNFDAKSGQLSTELNRKRNQKDFLLRLNDILHRSVFQKLDDIIKGKNQEQVQVDSSDDEGLFPNAKPFTFETQVKKSEVAQKENVEADLASLFEEDLDYKNKFKIPELQPSSISIYDYWDPSSTKPTSKNTQNYSDKKFDVAQFRIRESQKRNKPQKGNGLGQFGTNDEGYGIKMDQMDMNQSKINKMENDSDFGQKVINSFQDEKEAIKDQAWMDDQTRQTFSFGGQSVRDRLKQKKSNAKLGNDAAQIERMLKKRKNEADSQSDASKRPRTD